MKFKQLVAVTIAALSISFSAGAQQLLTGYDSTGFMRDTLRPLVKRFQNLHVSAYIQPQFQIAQQKGAEGFAGGDFEPNANNRFIIRRARLKIDYEMPSKRGDYTAAVFTFQFEATERSVGVRDMFVRVYEPSKRNFSLTTGLFIRPFGYELTLPSTVRETHESGRMAQILMPGERDLGAMVSFEPRKEAKKRLALKWSAGLFNGQGNTGPVEFDSYKDFISGLRIGPVAISKRLALSGGLSVLHGAVAQGSKYKYAMGAQNGLPLFIIDSSLKNKGAPAPRRYYAADVQTSFKWGSQKTDVRAEYWAGTQPGLAENTTTVGKLPSEPTYIRPFNGAFFYLVQTLVENKWEAAVKYDWYDPNTKVSGAQIGAAGANLTEADIKFATLGFGATRYLSSNLKLMAYYDWVRNEKTLLTPFTDDVKDNVFTLRIQMRF